MPVGEVVPELEGMPSGDVVVGVGAPVLGGIPRGDGSAGLPTGTGTLMPGTVVVVGVGAGAGAPPLKRSDGEATAAP